jgi:small-conductance mechanosensitive channel
MLEPIDPSRFESALGQASGWAELAIVAACLGLAWMLDRMLVRRAPAPTSDRQAHVYGGVARVAFPLTALALLVLARFAFRHFGHRPFLIDVAMPLLFALAAIRMVLYAMRRLFAAQAWLKTGERAIAFSIWGAVVLYFTGVLPDLAAELDAIRIPIGRTEVSVLTLGNGMLAVALTLILTLWLSGIIEQRLLSATSLDTNTKAVLAKFVRAVLLVLGVLFALEAIGFDLTLLTVFGGALGVGIGLGLQKLASNYIAGFTILLDRSIRLGDMITVGNRFGVVAKVTSRYVVVRGFDGIDAVVPNETLVTTTVLNHSYRNREIRLAVPVQVSCDSDVELALRLMEEAAHAEARVLKAPNGPLAFLVGFAESGINLELGVSIGDPENGQGNVRSALNLAILRAFRANGIRMPIPQREVRIVSAQGGERIAPAGDPRVGPAV